ncbi:MAG TPA: hypothetical protein VH373_22170 [Jatrophihabitantaceae bacterium]
MRGLDGAASRTSTRHYSTHASVLSRPSVNGRRRLSGIVVSAARPAAYTASALRLGADLGAPVVLMCSRNADANDAIALAQSIRNVQAVVIDLSAASDVGLPRFRTSAVRPARHGALGDLSRKRNLGLMLGKLAGWRSLLFLDDDIYGWDLANVERAVTALDQHTAVGMPALSFPDNSIVCHAHRLVEPTQDVFVSGSALIVDVQQADTFFPEIYNEDWLFLAPHIERGRVGAVGSVTQLAYDPFAKPRRAADQEFGDVLAEGLMGYLHSSSLRPPPSVEYWEAFLQARAAFIEVTMVGCLSPSLGASKASSPLPALDEAARALSEISAASLVEYVNAWLADLGSWRAFVGDLPSLGSLDEAVNGLELPAVTIPGVSRLRGDERSAPRFGRASREMAAAP